MVNVFKTMAEELYLAQKGDKTFDYIVLQLLRTKFACGEFTLEEIGYIYGVSRERIRQIQDNALRKLRNNKDKVCVSL